MVQEFLTNCMDSAWRKPVSPDTEIPKTTQMPLNACLSWVHCVQNCFGEKYYLWSWKGYSPCTLFSFPTSSILYWNTGTAMSLHFHRVREQGMAEGGSHPWKSPGPNPCSNRPPIAGCPGPHPNSFWLSLRDAPPLLWPLQHWEEGKDELPPPALNTLPNTVQVTIILLCGNGTLLAHIPLGVHQAPYSLLFYAAGSTSACTSTWCCSSEGAQLCTSCRTSWRSVRSLLQPAHVPLDSSMFFSCICHPSHFWVVGRSAEGTHWHITHIISEGI